MNEHETPDGIEHEAAAQEAAPIVVEKTPEDRLGEINSQLTGFEDQNTTERTEHVQQEYRHLAESDLPLSEATRVQLEDKMNAEIAAIQKRGYEKQKQLTDLQIEKAILENSLGQNIGYEKVPVKEHAVDEMKAVLASQTENLLGPLVIGNGETAGVPLKVKSTRGMGRAAFIEAKINADGQDFSFLQWKGVDSTVGGRIEQGFEAVDGNIDYVIGGKDDFSPLMLMTFPGGRESVRFRGTSFYRNLLREEEKSRQFAQYGLRMPKIVKTIKLSREFCRANRLPVPKNELEGDMDGETLKEFLDREGTEIANDKRERMLSSYEAKKHNSGFVLGQSVRAFRNVWRVDDIEKMSDEEAVAQAMDVSKNILSEEFGVELNEQAYAEKFSQLLGKQVAILLENRLVQGAMRDHKQDITLAAEICDFDGAYNVDEFLADPNNEPQWLKDGSGTREEWVKERDLRLYRQILLVGAHVRPVSEAVKRLKGEDVSETAMDSYVDGIVSNLSDEKRQKLEQFLLENQAKQETQYDKKFQNLEDIVGGSEVARRNFAGYEVYFDDITDRLLKKLRNP